jgi:RNA polymerase sigma factor (sigma-70 family)
LTERGLSADEVSSVYQRYGALLARRSRLLMRDAALAEDALQELCTTLLRRGETFRAAEKPYKWLCRAVDRTCLDLMRRGKRVRNAEPLDASDPVGPAPGMDQEARLAALQMLAQLTDDQQSLAIMLFVDGMTQGEAATELGVSRVTVNKRTQEIRLRLGLASQEAQESVQNAS